jgi:hypothetical protein
MISLSLVGDGIADDTAGVQASAVAGVPLPPGRFRITSDIFLTAHAARTSGISLIGAGMDQSIIIADYNGTSLGGIIRIDSAGAGMYSYGSELRDIQITQAAGRTGLVGVQLTAAWFVKMTRVYINGVSSHGIAAPLRSDINPISDFYQNFSVLISQCQIAGCQGWGINFGAGQSPGLFEISYSILAGNLGGGIRSTTGQCRILANLIVGNGQYGGMGGLFFDTAEGPSMVGEVRQNEFDTNFSWHMNLVRSRGLVVSRNRFLSQTYASNTSPTLQSGSTFMRPFLHVNLGAGSAGEVYSAVFEYNLHRTVTGPAKTTASVIAYDASAGSLSPSAPVQLLHNDLSGADGITQNSSALLKFVSLGSGTGAIVVDP